jgi:hydroxymethylpyrimidine/phosphomethylpyrimidine kinase
MSDHRSGVAVTEFPVALTIAGSDSGGGAGIQADLKTFHAFGVFGTSAITALTAQNTIGVRSVHAVPLQMVRDQVDAVAEDLAPKAVKSGMLATAALVVEVAELIERHGLRNYVLDPVMVASSGDRLLDEDAEGSVANRLVPMATLVTPNLDEARILTGLGVVGEAGQREAARALVEMGAGAALVKGGHGEGSELLDLFWDGEAERIWRRPRVVTRNTHGTGCTLSAGVAAGLALGRPLEDAVDRALDYVARAIAAAPGLGGRGEQGGQGRQGRHGRHGGQADTAGHGPVNHMIPVG